jgi:hypothetical protein
LLLRATRRRGSGRGVFRIPRARRTPRVSAAQEVHLLAAAITQPRTRAPYFRLSWRHAQRGGWLRAARPAPIAA